VQSFGSRGDVAIGCRPILLRTPPVIRAKLESVLQSVDSSAEVQHFGNSWGAAVGKELKTSASWALAFTLLLIRHLHRVPVSYLAFVLGAILAVIHDPILVLGTFRSPRLRSTWPLSRPILAVIGYSLNDTVVVFDRIRERLETNRPAATGLSYSISRSTRRWSRTIMTKVVTSIVVVACCSWAARSCKDSRGLDDRASWRVRTPHLHLECLALDAG